MASTHHSSHQQDPSVVPRTRVAGDNPEVGEPAIFCADLNGEFVGCNSLFTRLFGYSAQELGGRDFSALFTAKEKSRGEEKGQLRKEILAAASAGGDFHSTLLAHPKSGPSFAVQLSTTVLCGSFSKRLEIVAVVEVLDGSHITASSNLASEIPPVPGVIVRRIDGTHFILASPVMHEFMSLVDRVASHSETVLITGETGTGKELIARTIHESSHRRTRAWVDIKCAALPENLVESELFGYEKGAFSGADSSKPGLFELADKGTLFLDEIGELQLQTQVKLLRVLDGQPFYRLGGHRKIKVDVRIVAATNQDLEAAVR